MEIANIKRQFGEYLYSRLPKVYRAYDVEIKRSIVIDGQPTTVIYRTLEEYLRAFALGGFQPLLEDIEAVLSLIDPQKCPIEYLPYMLQHFGLDYIDDIPERFQRRLLQNALILYRKKGTLPAVVFLARELSGFEVVVEETERNGVSFALVKLSAFTEEENQELELAQKTIERYIHLFLPATVQPEVSTVYGYSEGICFNVDIPSGTTLDWVKYNFDDEAIDGGFVQIYDEEYKLLQNLVEIDFNNIRNWIEDENDIISLNDIDAFTNSYHQGGWVYTNAYSTLDKII